MSTNDEAVLLVLIDHPGLTSLEIADLLGVPTGQAAASLQVLARLGLVAEGDSSAHDSTYVATAPLVAVEPVLLEKERALVDALAHAQELSVRFLRSRANIQPSSAVETLSGAQVVTQRVRHARFRARERVRTFTVINGTRLADEGIAAGLLRDSHLRTNVREQLLWAADSIPPPPELALRSRVDVRFGAPREFSFLVVDDGLAIVEAEGVTGEAIVIHPCALLDAVVALFDRWWETAIRPPREACVGVGALGAESEELVRLMLTGLTDESIARHLGISHRSCQRRVASLLRQLGARTRFEAGAKVAAMHDESSPSSLTLDG